VACPPQSNPPLELPVLARRFTHALAGAAATDKEK